MKWLLNMKVAGKLLILVIPAFIIIFVLIGLIQYGLTTVNDSLSQSLYNEAYVSTVAILNADRDFYQAAIAEEQLNSAEDALRRDGLISDYEENAAQVEERVSTAMGIISGNADLYEEAVHEATGLTLQELDQSFQKNFSTWKRLYDPETGDGDIAAHQDAFDTAREELNRMTEILDVEAKASTVQMKEGLSSALSVFFGIAVAVVVLVGALAVYLIISIRNGIQYVTRISRKIAQGDLTVKIDPRKQSKDEIGQLLSTVDHEVRDAFRDIEKGRMVADKQARYQSAEVDKLVVNLERLAAGELYCDMEAAEPDADTQKLYELFKSVSDNMHRTVDTLRTYIAETTDVLGAMSKGDLTLGIDSEFHGDFAKLKQAINSIARSLNDVLSEINTAAEQVSAGTTQVSEGSQEISQGATEQAASIEELSATVTEIAEQTKKNAASAGEANKLTLSAKDDADKGSERMQEMQGAMTEINEASENISKIIKVIDDIAFQTNILALNAAVEAARAGVHGKGFAVVAEEVRNLAARSANAAKETTALIEGSVIKTEAGNKIADETAQALVNIVSGVEQAAQLVGEIAAASEKQAGAITQVNGGIDQVNQVVQTNSATSEETASAAEELSSQAELLKEMVGRFTLSGEERAEKPRPETGESAPPRDETEGPVEVDGIQIDLNDDEFGKY